MISDDTEEFHVKIGERVVDLVPFGRQLVEVLGVAFNVVADAHDEVWLKSVDRLD